MLKYSIKLQKKIEKKNVKKKLGHNISKTGILFLKKLMKGIFEKLLFFKKVKQSCQFKCEYT